MRSIGCSGSDYQVHCKDYSSARARNLAATVLTWADDPRNPRRQLGWVTEAADEYILPVHRLAARWQKKNGQWCYAVIISTLEPSDLIELTGQPSDRVKDQHLVMGAYAAFYDQRGGTIEIEIKEDKQGVAMAKRSKKRFAAQQMVMLLGSLAHNIIVWSRRWLSEEAARFARYGALRMVRDLFHVSGLLEFNDAGEALRITLNRAALGVRELAQALTKLLAPEAVEIRVGAT